MRRIAVLAVFGMACVVLPTSAQPKDGSANPPYKNWSKFAKGTTVTLKQTVIDKGGDSPNRIDTTARPGGAVETMTTFKLLEIAPERVVVEEIQTEVGIGQRTEHAPVKLIFPATLEKHHKDQTLGKDKVGNFKEGEEELEVAGEKIKCRWAESEIKVDGETSTSKLWWSDAVPGGTVKEVTTKKQGNKVLYETTTILTHKHVGK